MQQAGYINYYYDCLNSFANEIDELVPKKNNPESELIEYGLLKNKLSGVREVNIACQDVQLARQLLQKYQMRGVPVINTLENFQKDVIFHIQNILSYSEVELEEIVHKSKLYNIPIMVTFGRTLYELGEIDKSFAMSPVTYLESLGILDRQCIILGGNYIDKDDLIMLASYDAKIVVTPISDMRHARGFVNLAPILNQGIDIGFASDDSPTVDILNEVKLGAGQTANLMLSYDFAPMQNLIKFAGGGQLEAVENQELASFKAKIKEKLWK